MLSAVVDPEKEGCLAVIEQSDLLRPWDVEGVVRSEHLLDMVEARDDDPTRARDTEHRGDRPQ